MAIVVLLDLCLSMVFGGGEGHDIEGTELRGEIGNCPHTDSIPGDEKVKTMNTPHKYPSYMNGGRRNGAESPGSERDSKKRQTSCNSEFCAEEMGRTQNQ